MKTNSKNSPKKNDLSEILEFEKANELKRLFLSVNLYLGVPMWATYWMVDWITYPDQKWTFLPLRIFAIFLALSSKYIYKRFGTTATRIKIIGALHGANQSVILTIMIFMTGGKDSLYWVGVNLVSIAYFTFLPWQAGYLFLCVILSYAPYYIGLYFQGIDGDYLPILFANSYFNLCVVIIALTNRFFSEQLRKKELDSRVRLIDEIALRDSIIAEQTEKAVALELEASLGRQAAQVAHDIRSPLSAFRTIAADLLVLPEAQRVILRSAIQRMTHIANTLQNRNKGNLKTDQIRNIENKLVVEPLAIASALSEIIAEKEVEHRSVSGLSFHLDVNADSYPLFTSVDENEFKRLISNLLNNSIEALSTNSNIYLKVFSTDSFVSVEIKDKGKGIPPEILPTLGTRGVSFGKKSGQGLGLYHARTQVESWGGQFNILSTVGVGTIIRIVLPLAKTPDWFLPKLTLTPSSRVVILDDEPSIHLAWNYRLKKLNSIELGIECISLYSPESFEEFIKNDSNSAQKPTIYLIDFEFRQQKVNGLDVIDQFGISKNSILVSSRYFEEPVLSRCKTLGVKVVPKLMAGLIPIELKLSG